MPSSRDMFRPDDFNDDGVSYVHRHRFIMCEPKNSVDNVHQMKLSHEVEATELLGKVYIAVKDSPVGVDTLKARGWPRGCRWHRGLVVDLRRRTGWMGDWLQDAVSCGRVRPTRRAGWRARHRLLALVAIFRGCVDRDATLVYYVLSPCHWHGAPAASGRIIDACPRNPTIHPLCLRHYSVVCRWQLRTRVRTWLAGDVVRSAEVALIKRHYQLDGAGKTAGPVNDAPNEHWFNQT